MSDANALSTHGLTRSFGRNHVIRGLDLVIPRGSVYGFLGRNGAGKTTTIRMLMGILYPDGGTIELGGLSVRRTTPKLRQSIGYVSQHQHFYPWMKVVSLGRFVGACYPTWDEDYFLSLLDGLCVERWQRVGELSGGTRMKLALALALAHRPPLLVLDEPTAGVDPVTRREILDLLRELAAQGQTTVFFSTHQLSEIEDIGTHVGILHQGQMFWQGEVAALHGFARRIEGALPDGARALYAHPDGGVVAWAEPLVWETVSGAQSVTLEDAFVAIARQDSA